MTKTIENKAVSYLEKILEGLKIDGKIKSTSNEEGLFLEVEGGDAGILIGRDGSTLSAVEFILSIIANKGQEERLRVHVDTEGYKEEKKLRLETLAVEAAEKVEQENRPVTMGPMTPYERRIVHLTLRENTSVRTESEGQDPERYIIVKPL